MKKFLLVIEIKSANISATLIKDDILYSRKKDLFFTEKPNPDQLFVQMQKNLDGLLLNLINDLPKISRENGATVVPAEIVVVYGAPWYDAKYSNFSIDRKKEFKLTQKIIEKVINNSEKTDHSIVTGNAIPIEKKITSIKLNGYEVENPIGGVTKRADFAIYSSFIGTQIYSGFEKIIRKHFHHIIIKKQTYPITLYEFLRKNFHNLKDFAILEITGEMIEIILIKNYGFEKVFTIPTGTHFFIRKLAEILSCDLHTATTNLKLYEKDEMNSGHEHANQIVYKDLQREFLAKLRHVLEKNQAGHIPSNFFIVSDGKFKQLFRQIFSSAESYLGVFKLPEKPIIHFVDSDVFFAENFDKIV